MESITKSHKSLAKELKYDNGNKESFNKIYNTREMQIQIDQLKNENQKLKANNILLQNSKAFKQNTRENSASSFIHSFRIKLNILKQL